MPTLVSSPWSKDTQTLFDELSSESTGLTTHEAEQRLAADGPNEIERDKPTRWWQIFFRQFTSPLVLVLIGASLISMSLGERAETIIILIIVFLGGTLAFVQEYRSERALRELRKRLTRYATVKRDGRSTRIDAARLVRGDIVELDLGNVIPADLRLFQIQDLEIDESVITGESVPVAKNIDALPLDGCLPQEQLNIAFMGTHVVQGSGRGIVVGTGRNTEVGRTASLLTTRIEETNFQKGIRSFGNFLLKITLGLALIVAVILGIVHGNWAESLLFALALAVGISPELLPLIVTINLSRGALAMSKKHVLVKRLIAIEDLGNADVFCTDKTGTLTVGKLRVRESIDPTGAISSLPLAYAATCLEIEENGRASTPMDQAIFEATKKEVTLPDLLHAVRYDIISFDFTRRRMSCVIGVPHDTQRWMIVKGASAEVIAQCTSQTASSHTTPLDEAGRARLLAASNQYADQGYRLLAVARRPISEQPTYSPSDEKNLELIGFVLISDAPKVTAKAALVSLQQLHTRIVILTGDNERVTRHVAKQLGFEIIGLLTGDDVETLSDAELERNVEQTNVFARITPAHKLRVIQALKANGHTVGFMGDGVNDAPALRAADVGISFDDAVDVAKEAAGIILLQKKLSVLADGIREGRRTFVNTRTYLRSTISSNFGNMLSVAGAALLLPFIPLLPAQILLLNLLSDIPMLSISTDRVDDEDLAKPKHWDIQELSNFMYFFGTISSIADYTTFALLLFVARADVQLFRSSWFIESLITEIFVVALLRTKKLSLTDPPGIVLQISSLLTIGIAVALNQSSVGSMLGLVPLPPWIFVAIAGIVIGYGALVEIGKLVYFRFKEQTV